MIYPMGYSIPTFPWTLGEDTTPTKGHGIAQGPSLELTLSWLAHYLKRLSLSLVLHNIPYLLLWDW